MEIQIYDSDGSITAFKTRESAIKAFKEWYVDKVLTWEDEKEYAIKQMEEEGYYYDEQIYPTDLLDQQLTKARRYVILNVSNEREDYKMGLFNRNKKEEVKKIETVTLKHYKMVFKTIDEEVHEFNKINPINESVITCSALEYYLNGEKFLKDDAGVHYPIQNVISIKFELDRVIENVEKVVLSDSLGLCLVWYPKDSIKII